METLKHKRELWQCFCGYQDFDYLVYKDHVYKCTSITAAFAAKPDKQDLGKPRWSLLPWQQVEDVLQVLMFGAKKYCDDGWQTIEDGRKRYLEAAQRHLAAYFKGERQDKESGLLTLAHAVCSLLFVMWYDGKGEK